MLSHPNITDVQQGVNAHPEAGPKTPGIYFLPLRRFLAFQATHVAHHIDVFRMRRGNAWTLFAL